MFLGEWNSRFKKREQLEVKEREREPLLPAPLLYFKGGNGCERSGYLLLPPPPAVGLLFGGKAEKDDEKFLISCEMKSSMELLERRSGVG